MKPRNKFNILPFLAALGWVGFVFWAVGCVSNTIRPIAAPSHQASYDGSRQDSGIIGFVPGGALVTSHFRDRYNSMIAKYGHEPRFTPPLVADRGVTPATPAQQAAHTDRGPLFVFTDEALGDFILMNDWRREGRLPTAPKEPGIIAKTIDKIL